ncbi:MAG: heme exporter protein CcmB [Burkholderiaceae bacterium]
MTSDRIARDSMTSNDEPLLGVFGALRWSCRRDLRVLLRNRADPLLALVFFVLVATLFPLSVNPDPALLRTLAPGIVWIAALLSLLLGLPRLFAHDHVDGTLEQLLLASAPLPALITGKVLAHWIAHCLPVVLLSPLIGLQFGLPPDAIGLLMLTLLLGSPILSWLGAITSALTLGSRGGSALLALLILPLAIPVLIFGSGAIDSQQAGLGAAAHLSLLGAGCLGALVLGPAAATLAVRIAYE